MSRRAVEVSDGIGQLPYSKGLMASSMTVSGLPLSETFKIAQKIEDMLRRDQRKSVTRQQLREMAVAMLREAGGPYADVYLKWQAVEELDAPLIVLIGGATGVGKSTAATQLAARLGITRVISSDAVREVLRSALSPVLMPVLHVSSFEAGSLPIELRSGAGPIVGGFIEQVKTVSVGIEALVARALKEKTDIIIEGAHVVPGFIGQIQQFPAPAVIAQMVLTIESEELHRNHFLARGEQGPRGGGKYLESFDKIRVIQDFIEKSALETGVPVVEAFDLDSTLQDLT
ncbi:MAG: ATP cone domain-containing protein, partial [Actinomycetota bacterium]